MQSRKLAEQHRFFHWHVEFPDIAADGGFDVMMGNPPWEVLAVRDEEWFAAKGRGDIASADTKDARKRMIRALRSDDASDGDRRLVAEYDTYVRQVAAIKHLLSDGGRYRFGAAGSLDMYATFTDLAWMSKKPGVGRVGMVVRVQLAVGMYQCRSSRTWCLEERWPRSSPLRTRRRRSPVSTTR